MENNVEITIGGAVYPCRPTMGAMLRFKQETGREVTGIVSSSISDLCLYRWCCVASASACDKIEFNMSLMDFADNMTPESLNDWAVRLRQEITSSSGNKTQK